MPESVIITCAVTGGGDTAFRYPAVPVTPEQIATSAIEAAKAGAAVAHIHVRDPVTGKPSMGLDHYREVVERIRDSGVDLILNLTTGVGARFFPNDEDPARAGPGSTIRRPSERVQHVLALRPEICSLDMGTLNFGGGALVNVQRHIEEMAAAILEVGVKPELEAFDTGHVMLALDMIDRGLIDARPLFQFVLGARWSAPARAETLIAMRSLLPQDAVWGAFGIGVSEYPIAAQSTLLGGHVRVGLEDNLYLEKGRVADSNAALVERAVDLIRLLGRNVATVPEARVILGIL